MTVQVSNPAFVHDLLASLKGELQRLAKRGHDGRGEHPAGCDGRAGALHLGFYLANWRARTRGSSRTSFAELSAVGLRRIGGRAPP